MPNTFTRVPDQPAPQLSGAMRPILWLADLFMGLMWSRPGGLSLKSTWVTPATAWLCGGVAVFGAIVAAILLTGSHSVTSWIGFGLIAILWIGSAAVIVTWTAQHAALHRR